MKVSSSSLPKEAGLLAEDLNLMYSFAGVGNFKSLVTCQESCIMKVSSGSLPKEAGLLADDLNLIYCFAGVGDF